MKWIWRADKNQGQMSKSLADPLEGKIGNLGRDTYHLQSSVKVQKRLQWWTCVGPFLLIWHSQEMRQSTEVDSF